MTSGFYIARGYGCEYCYFNLTSSGASQKSSSLTCNFTGDVCYVDVLSSCDWKNLCIEAFKCVYAILRISFAEDASVNAYVELIDKNSGTFSSTSGPL